MKMTLKAEVRIVLVIDDIEKREKRTLKSFWRNLPARRDGAGAIGGHAGAETCLALPCLANA